MHLKKLLGFLVYIEQDILQMVQSISKETFGFSSVIFDLDGFCKREPFPNDMCPTHRKQPKAR